MSKRKQPGITRHAKRRATELGIDMPESEWHRAAIAIETGMLEVTGGQGERLAYDMDFLREDDSKITMHITYDWTTRRVVDVRKAKA